MSASPLVRWWRSRGHGVHSPYAYRMVTQVLRPAGSHYATVSLLERPQGRWLCLVFRLVCEARPSHATVQGPRAEDMRMAIALADSRVQVTVIPSSARADAVEMHGAPDGLRLRAMQPLELSPALWRSICDGFTEGMTFSDGHTGVAVQRRGLPRQHFDVYIDA